MKMREKKVENNKKKKEQRLRVICVILKGLTYG